MMYESKLAAAIKVAGKVLREYDKDKVYLPFGSEYSIFLKNKNSRRAVAHVVIDGNDVGDGRGFVVPAFGEIDITRFITNGNLEEGNSFKFIERSGKVEEHRGVGIDDGLVEINFQFERPTPRIHHFTDPYPNRTYGGGWNDDLIGSPLRGGSSGDAYFGSGTNTTCSTRQFASNSADVNNVSLDSFSVAEVSAQNETGITAPGSLNDQQFSDAGYIPLEIAKHSMVFHLLGETEDNRAIREARTVKHKPRCVSCGTFNAHNAKFCSHCGTSLQIV